MYRQIFEGNWLSDASYGTIHRIATDGELPGLGSWVIQWCLDLCGSIRIDTHEDNVLMRRTLEKAKRYAAKKEAGEDVWDDGLEPLLPLLRGEIPAHFHAHRADDILTAIRIAKEQGRGAIALRGKMIDAPIVNRAKQTIEAAEELGLGRSDI